MYLRRFMTYSHIFLNHQDTILRNRLKFLQEHFLSNHSNIGMKHINTVWAHFIFAGALEQFLLCRLLIAPAF